MFQRDSRIKSVELSPGGVLCVRACGEARQDVLEFLQVFDRPARGLDVQVLLLKSATDSADLPAADSLSGSVREVLETIAELNVDKRLAIVDRVEMPTLEHQKTSALLYHTAPVVVASRMAASGDVIPRISLVTPGATVHVIAEVSTDGTILLDLELKAREVTGAVLIPMILQRVKEIVMRKFVAAGLFWTVVALHASAGDVGNRLIWLDGACNPYYVGSETPKLTTPQWIGEKGVEAVIVLSIDDMRATEPYEKCLRPIIRRLKKIDGRGPVSIMTNRADATDPQLAKWAAEGVTVEAHTATHPCPCLQGSDLAKARQSYDEAIDLLARIPGGPAIAFRMPCCDSMNSVGPRFFTELFGKTTAAGNFLQLDSSVFLAFTADDPALPRSLTTDEEGRPRFTKYVPRDRNFVNYVDNYPYPFVIDHLCWEMPSPIPDDWLGFNLQGAHHPTTVRDMKAAIDAAVLKQGTFTLTFHPDRWIRNDQVIQLIDHATSRHSNKVKFLNFREVLQRLTTNLLGGQPLRTADGRDNGVRLLDLNNDGYMDVVIGNDEVRQTRVWSPQTQSWSLGDFPVQIVGTDHQGRHTLTGVRFGVLQKSGYASILVRNEEVSGLWHFDGRGWTAVTAGLDGLTLDTPVRTADAGIDRGVRFFDLDADGVCELIIGNPRLNAVFRWSPDARRWTQLPFGLPVGTAIVDHTGSDAGLRLVDVDKDGRADVFFSNGQRYSLHLFQSMVAGWNRTIREADRSEDNAIPMIVRSDGTNNGTWFHDKYLYVQNEDTGKRLPNHIDVRSYAQLLKREKEAP